MDRYSESEATIDSLIVEELCGRQASNVRVQTYTYLISTNQKANSSVEAARRLYGCAHHATHWSYVRSSEGQPYASLAEACEFAMTRSASLTFCGKKFPSKFRLPSFAFSSRADFTMSAIAVR